MVRVVRKARHPAIRAVERERRDSFSTRVADVITKFAGSMVFIYIHLIVFIIWCSTGLFGIDHYPFNFLTLAVSLEAIFLATFVMIGQNRQGQFQQAKADHEYEIEHTELLKNTEITHQIHLIALKLQSILDENEPKAVE